MAGAVGVVNMNGGTVIKDGLGNTFTMLGYGGTGEWNQNGGTFTDNTAVILGQEGGYSGTINLNGGVFSTGAIQVGFTAEPTAAGRVYFNGGTLKVNPASIYLASVTTSPTYGFLTAYASTDAHAYVKSGGAIIDTSGVDIMIAMPLEEDSVSTGGGLTKIGLGTLNLNGYGYFTGPTVVQEGTLSLNQISFASSAITVKSGATLAGSTSESNPFAYPATTVEASGTVAPGTIGSFLRSAN